MVGERAGAASAAESPGRAVIASCGGPHPTSDSRSAVRPDEPTTTGLRGSPQAVRKRAAAGVHDRDEVERSPRRCRDNRPWPARPGAGGTRLEPIADDRVDRAERLVINIGGGDREGAATPTRWRRRRELAG